MKIALIIFKYFPHGGLQLDFRRLAQECVARGWQTTVFARSFEGETLPGTELRLLPVRGFANHGRARNFERRMHAILAEEKFDLVVGFNRMAGLDLYFAADNCFALESGRHAGFKRLFTRRYAVYEAMEKAVFDPAAKTEIMHLTEQQKRDYISVYGTPASRFHLLPPGIDPDRRRPVDDKAIRGVREYVRNLFAVADSELLLLQVCSGFATKGVDRTIRAFAALLPELRKRTRLLIAGREKSSRFARLAASLGVADRVVFAGGRDDVGALLLASDLMVHPPRKEATGTVLVEALAAGLPVLTTANCGYAPYVEAAGGVVLAGDFVQLELDRALANVLGMPGKLEKMRTAAVAYGKSADFYTRAKVAADLVAMLAGRK